MNCPSCEKNGVTENYWLVAWPFSVRCSFCGSKIRSNLSIKYSVMAQVVTVSLMFGLWLPLREQNIFISIVLPAIVSFTVGMLVVKKYSKPGIVN